MSPQVVSTRGWNRGGGLQLVSISGILFSNYIVSGFMLGRHLHRTGSSDCSWSDGVVSIAGAVVSPDNNSFKHLGILPWLSRFPPYQ